MDDFEVEFDSFADDANEWEAGQVAQDNEGESDGEDFDGEVSDEGDDDDFNADDGGEDGWLDGSYEE